MSLFSRSRADRHAALDANQSTVDDFKDWIVEGDNFRDWLAEHRRAREARDRPQPPTSAEAHAGVKEYALTIAELELAKAGRRNPRPAEVRREASRFLQDIVRELAVE